MTELNEYLLSSFQDRKMVLDQAKNSKKAAIKSLLNGGYTQAEVAERLGISTSTVNRVVNG